MEEAGLYYLKSENDLSERTFKNSIIITDREHVEVDNSNAQIIVEGDSQIVVYKLFQDFTDV